MSHKLYSIHFLYFNIYYTFNLLAEIFTAWKSKDLGFYLVLILINYIKKPNKNHCLSIGFLFIGDLIVSCLFTYNVLNMVENTI